jgi:hypothetical protein
MLRRSTYCWLRTRRSMGNGMLLSPLRCLPPLLLPWSQRLGRSKSRAPWPTGRKDVCRYGTRYRNEPLTVRRRALVRTLEASRCLRRRASPSGRDVHRSGRVRPRAFDLVGSVGRGSVPAWPYAVASLFCRHGGSKH